MIAQAKHKTPKISYKSTRKIGKMTNILKNEKGTEKIRSLYSYAYLIQVWIIFVAVILLFFLKFYLIDARIGDNPLAISNAYDIYWLELSAVFLTGFGIMFNWIFYTIGKNKLLTSFLVMGILLNVSLSSIFIFELNLGVFGAGLGTIISVAFTFIIKIAYLLFNSQTRNFIIPTKYFIKIIEVKDAISKWYVVPYELLFFLIEFLFFYAINLGFPKQIIIYGIIAPFIYMFAGIAGMTQIIMKYNVQYNLSEKNKKDILIISLVRILYITFIGLAILITLILYSPIYDVSYSTRIEALIALIAITISVALFSPFYDLAFDVALLSKKNKSFYIYDILFKWILLVSIFVASIWLHSITWFIIMMVTYQTFGALIPFLLFKPIKHIDINN